MAKIIKYQMVLNPSDDALDVVLKCDTEEAFQENLLIAKAEAYNGEYTVEEKSDKKEQIESPSQLDIIEAQVTYTAMMTDTLLEV